MHFVDLKTQYKKIETMVDQRIKTVFEHGQFIMGPEVDELEKKLADFVGVEHCIGVSSGTDALMIALMALDIEPGDEVITTPFTFIATAEVIALLKAKPVFVDIDPKTYNIDPDKIEAAITTKTKAIIAVSLFGQCARFDKINTIAKAHNISVIEDAAQSFGATQHGVMSCSLTQISCTSFFPSKPLGGFGDGGACFTNSNDLAQTMREIRSHGQRQRYIHTRIGINARIDTIQAAAMIPKIDIFPDEVKARIDAGLRYTELLSGIPCNPPVVEQCNTSVYAQYTIQVDNREHVQKHMSSKGIPTAIHYPRPLHLQPAIKNLYKSLNSLNNAESAANHVMSIPIHPYISHTDQKRVVEALSEALC